MWQKMLKNGGGRSAWASLQQSDFGNEIQLGFKPTYIMLICQYQSGSNWLQLVSAYNAPYNDAKMSQFYDNVAGEYPLPNTTRIGIGSVSENGFTPIAPGSTVRYAIYFAAE